ncbi:MAG: hypothetical protein HYX38_28730 [Rhodospirillales bacterium]|nr:hypothetical protein [Rhodospirillales bacterium]
MLNNLFNAIALVALIGAAFLAPAPPAASPRTTAAAGSVAHASVPVSTASTELRAQQQPVPVIRSAPTRPIAVPLDDLSRSEAKAPSQSGLDREAAKVAIEADGYKRVRIVDKAANGTWRAKAFRGSIEVVVVVDEAGRVLTE